MGNRTPPDNGPHKPDQSGSPSSGGGCGDPHRSRGFQLIERPGDAILLCRQKRMRGNRTRMVHGRRGRTGICRSSGARQLRIVAKNRMEEVNSFRHSGGSFRNRRRGKRTFHCVSGDSLSGIAVNMVDVPALHALPDWRSCDARRNTGGLALA